jgi:hypothetical protein
MAQVNSGRYTANLGADGKVLFLIGMRINRLWQFWKWIPVFLAMPKMLAELQKNPDLGLLGRPRTLISGRLIMVWQYWDSFDKLEAYSRAADRAHLPAWRSFNRRIRNNGTVGIFHETILLRDDTVETVYGNMPTMGLAAVTGAVPAAARAQSARDRISGQENAPPVNPY